MDFFYFFWYSKTGIGWTCIGLPYTSSGNTFTDHFTAAWIEPIFAIKHKTQDIICENILT